MFYLKNLNADLNAAITSVNARHRLSNTEEKVFAPRYEPINPPIDAAIKRGVSKPISIIPDDNLPSKPLIELISIKNAETALVFFGFAQFINIISGLKNIPPPIPTIPEIKPIIPPDNNAV